MYDDWDDDDLDCDEDYYCERCGEADVDCMCCESCGATIDEPHEWDCDEDL